MWVRAASSTASSGAGFAWWAQCRGSPGKLSLPKGGGLTKAPLQLSPEVGGRGGGQSNLLFPPPPQVPADGAAGPPHPAVGLPRCRHGDRSPHCCCPTPGGFGPTAPAGPPDPRCCHPAALPPRAGGFSPIFGGGKGAGGLGELGVAEGVSVPFCCGVWRWLGVLSLAAVGFRGVMGGLFEGGGGFSPTAGDHGGVGGV